MYAKALRIGDGEQLSEVDQTIMEMKAKGKHNKEIIKKLEEFKVFYSEKTISTRHMRILQKLQTKEEERMEELGASWTMEEVLCLQVCSLNVLMLTNPRTSLCLPHIMRRI